MKFDYTYIERSKDWKHSFQEIIANTHLFMHSIYLGFQKNCIERIFLLQFSSCLDIIQGHNETLLNKEFVKKRHYHL